MGGRKRNQRTWIEFALGTDRGQWTILSAAGVFLVGCCTLSWSLCGGNTDADSSFNQSLWMSWGLFFDPGTQTSLAADAPLVLKWVAFFFSVVGFLFNLLVLGKLVDVLRDNLARWRRRYVRLACEDHIVLLNWSCKTLFLLEEMLHETRNQGHKVRTVVVVLADMDQILMKQEIQDYVDPDAFHSNCKIVCRRGQPCNWEDLRKVSAEYAKEVVILKPESSSDLDVMQVMVTLGSMRMPLAGRIVAEVDTPDIVPSLKYIHPNAFPIHAREAANHVLCWMTINPLLGRCLASFCSFTVGSEFYVVKVGDIVGLVGSTFEQAARRFTTATPVAVKSKSEPVLIAPPAERPLLAEDVLVLLAPNKKALHGDALRQIRTRWARAVPPWTCDKFDHIQEEHATGATDISDERPKTYIIIGHPNDMMGILVLLEKFSPAGTEVHILSAVAVEERERLRAATNVSLKGTTTVKDYVGDRTSIAALKRLPLSGATAVLVLAETSGSPMRMDAECLASAVTVAGMLEGQFGLKEDAPIMTGPIICEILETRTDVLRMRNPKLRDRCMFFRSTALETGMFAMAASEPVVFETLEALFEPNNYGELVVEPISTFGLQGLPCDYWQVCERVKQSLPQRLCYEVLIGWKRKNESTPVMETSLARTEPIVWEEGDYLILLRRSGISASAPVFSAGTPKFRLMGGLVKQVDV